MYWTESFDGGLSSRPKSRKLSFFPPPGRLSPLSGLMQVLYAVTEPILRPIRRMLPGMGPFDFSPLVAILAIWVILQILGRLLLF